MHWSVCFPVLILVGTGWWTWQAYLSDPPWYAYPIAAGIALRCLIWLWQCRKQPLQQIKRLHLPNQELRR